MSKNSPSKDEPKAVEIRAEVRQVRNMADHTFNLILNLPEECREQAKVLLGWHLDEIRAVLEKVTR